MLVSAGGAGAGGARGAAAASAASSASSRSAQLRARWPLMRGCKPCRTAAAQHPLGSRLLTNSSRKRRPRLVLPAPRPSPSPSVAAAASSSDTPGGGGGGDTPASDSIRSAQQEQADAARAAKQALAAALLGGAGSSAYRDAAARAAVAAAPPAQQQQQQQRRFAYSRAPPSSSAAPATLPYGSSAAAERAVALNAPAFYTSEQAMSRQQRLALAVERAAAEAAAAAERGGGGEEEDEEGGPPLPAPGDLPSSSASAVAPPALLPLDWEGDALGDPSAGRQSTGNPSDAVPLLLTMPSAADAEAADDLGLEAAARLPAAAPAAAEAQGRAARRRERREALLDDDVDEEEGKKKGRKGKEAAAAAESGGPRRLPPRGPMSERTAERIAKFEARAREDAAAVAAAVGAATNPPGVVLAEGAYDPVDDLWHAKTWHPRRKLWSPVPTRPPRAPGGPVAAVANPRAPGFFRFHPVTSTLLLGWQAVFGRAGPRRDPAEVPRPPGAPWKALPTQTAREALPSPLERLSSALSAFAVEGKGGREVVFSEAMRLDGGSEDVPWLPRWVRVGPAAVAASEARRAAAAAAAEGSARGGGGAAAASAAAAAVVAAGVGGSGSDSDTTTGRGRRPRGGLVAFTPGRLLTWLSAGPGAAFTTGYGDPAAAPASRARAALDTGVPEKSSVRSFAYDAGYEYVSYSAPDRVAQLVLSVAYLAAAAVLLTWVHLRVSQGLALGLALSWGLGTLQPPKVALLFALAAGGKAWLYPLFFALRLTDRFVGWMGERLQAFFRAQALVWLAYLLLAPAHWHPLPLPWTPFTGA